MNHSVQFRGPVGKEKMYFGTKGDIITLSVQNLGKSDVFFEVGSGSVMSGSTFKVPESTTASFGSMTGEGIWLWSDSGSEVKLYYQSTDATGRSRLEEMAMAGRVRYRLYGRGAAVSCDILNAVGPEIQYFVMDESVGTCLGRLSAMFAGREEAEMFYRIANEKFFADHGVRFPVPAPEIK